jgi:hypothetical protein
MKLMAIPFPDLRYEKARDRLLQAVAILPSDGSEVIRLLIDEACRRCEAKAYGNAFGPAPQPGQSPEPSDPHPPG